MNGDGLSWPYFVINGSYFLLQLELVRVTLRDSRAALPPLILAPELAWAAYGLLHCAVPSFWGLAFAVAWLFFASLNALFIGRYAREELLAGLPAAAYWPALLLATSICYLGLRHALAGKPDALILFHQWVGALGTAGWSAAFFLRAVTREDLPTQSMTAAWLRIVGFDATLLCLGIVRGSGRLLFIGALAAAFDAAYIAALRRRGAR
jgi:hypothetical protein